MKKIVLFALVLYSGNCFSQFSDTTHYYVNYASTGMINKTNISSSYLVNNNVKFSVSEKSVTANLYGSWIYGKQQKLITNNDVSTSLDFNLFKTLNHFYYWGLGAYDKSYSLKINNRLQTGLGVGYNVFDRKNIFINISDGIIYEKANLYNASLAETRVYELFRNSFRLKYKITIMDIIVLDGIDFLQNALSNENDYIIKSNTNLSIKLKKWLSFTTSLTYNKISITRQENLLFTFGLNIERYF